MATCLPSNAPIQLGKSHSFMNSSAMCFTPSLLLGGFMYSSLNATHILSYLFLMMLQIIVLPYRKWKNWDCCEPPVARYLNVIASLSAGETVLQLLQLLFVTNGETNSRRWSNLSGLIHRYLWKWTYIFYDEKNVSLTDLNAYIQ